MDTSISSSIRYGVKANGMLFGQMPGRKGALPDVWLELPVTPGAARKALHGQLPERFVRLAIAVFGRRPVPADFNELMRFKDVLQQVQADSPALLPVAYSALRSNDISPKPTRTIVRRLKALMTAENIAGWATRRKEAQRRARFYPSAGEPKVERLNEVQRFWEHYGDRLEQYPPLTEAAWRWLLRQGTTVLLSEFEYFHQMRYKSPTWLLLAELQFERATPAVLQVAQRLAGTPCQREVLLALRRHLESGATLDAADADDIVDLVHEANMTVVEPGTKWTTLLKRARDYAQLRENLVAADMAQHRWDPLFEPFVTSQGVVVSPVNDGAELVREGHAMRNCLRRAQSYSTRAVEGLSRVARLQGAGLRASLELHRSSTHLPWQVGQIRGRFNSELAHPALAEAAKLTARKLNQRSA